MKLYYSPGATSMAAHIVLAEAGIAVDIEKVDLKTKRTASGADFAAISPKGYIPALLLDNGELLTETPAIMQYAADQAPQTGLAPAPASFERIRLQEWLHFIGSEIHGRFRPAFSPAATDETRAVAAAYVEKRFDWLEPQLAARAFLMGDSFTCADAYLYTVVNWSRFVKLDLNRWPSLKAYMKRIVVRPAVQAVLKAEGLIQ